VAHPWFSLQLTTELGAPPFQNREGSGSRVCDWAEEDKAWVRHPPLALSQQPPESLFQSKDEPEGGEGRAKFGKSFLF